MIIACPACSTRYVVPDSAIGVDGRTVRCAKCRHSWFQEGPSAETLIQATQGTAPAAPPPPAPPPPPPPAPPPPPPPAPPPPPPPAPPPPMVEPERAAADEAPAPQPEADVQEPSVAAAPPAVEAAPPPPEMPSHFEQAPPPSYADAPPAPEPVYDDTEAARYRDEFEQVQSAFEYEPPFRPRRNMVRMWTIAAVLFAIFAFGAIGAVAWRGLPDWVPMSHPTFAESQPGLVLDFPPNRQDRRKLPDGTQYFAASGTITNVGQTRRSVPAILIVLRDAQDRIVYTWVVEPPKRQLVPGESMTINEAVTDVPRSAKFADIGWKPG